MKGHERRLTFSPYDHKLTTKNVFTPDGRRVAYDTRTKGGPLSRIETVDIGTLEIRIIFESGSGAQGCVVTCHPFLNKFVFIKGLDNPGVNGAYCAHCRQGAIVDEAYPNIAENLDARDIYPPFTPGAMRGGSHVHVWHPDGSMISNTYEDAMLADNGLLHDTPECDANLRNIEVNLLGHPVKVKNAPGNHGGSSYSFLAARLVSDPAPGSNDISAAIEEGWIGINGYIRPDGTRQKKALAFQGVTVDAACRQVREVYITDLPEEIPTDAPETAGTATRRPLPPKGVSQRRVTRLCERRYPGIFGPRHWLKSTPDGSKIVFYAMDDAGIVQAYFVSPGGGAITAITNNPFSITSDFTISPDGLAIFYFAGGSLHRTEIGGETTRLTENSDIPVNRPVVVSPDGGRVVYARDLPHGETGEIFSQLCLFEFD